RPGETGRPEDEEQQRAPHGHRTLTYGGSPPPGKRTAILEPPRASPWAPRRCGARSGATRDAPRTRGKVSSTHRRLTYTSSSTRCMSASGVLHVRYREDIARS